MDPPFWKFWMELTHERRPGHQGKNVHSIWEIVRHINVWDAAAVLRMAGEVVQPEGEADWPKVSDVSQEAWETTVSNLVRTHKSLVKAAEAFPDMRLSERVPGKKQDFYNFYYMLHGLAQHELYHAGQIAILKKIN